MGIGLWVDPWLLFHMIVVLNFLLSSTVGNTEYCTAPCPIPCGIERRRKYSQRTKTQIFTDIIAKSKPNSIIFFNDNPIKID
jgi:hypothetical protein